MPGRAKIESCSESGSTIQCNNAVVINYRASACDSESESESESASASASSPPQDLD